MSERIWSAVKGMRTPSSAIVGIRCDTLTEWLDVTKTKVKSTCSETTDETTVHHGIE